MQSTGFRAAYSGHRDLWLVRFQIPFHFVGSFWGVSRKGADRETLAGEIQDKIPEDVDSNSKKRKTLPGTTLFLSRDAYAINGLYQSPYRRRRDEA